MGGDAAPTPTTSLLADQRSHWDRGERVPVEDYLIRQPDLRDNTEVLLDLIYAEVVLRREAGERPTPEEYVARFPALAEAIRTQFEVDGALDSAITHRGTGTSDSFQIFPQAPPGYEILDELGRGGMGVVYKARHRMLDRLVAIKMIRSGEFSDTEERARFEAEARAVARLSHPNIIQIFEIGEVNGVPYLALEYVLGESLADALRGDPFSPRPAAMLATTIARAVQHAHDAGIVHRDLKPANILLQSTKVIEQKTDKGQKTEIGGEWSHVRQRSSLFDTEILSVDLASLQLNSDIVPKITDFGLVKHIGADGPTRTGDFLGTPNFAPPEQAAGRSDLGPAADVYSLGAILYQMLTGRPPFVGATPLETLDQVRFTEPVPPSRLRPRLPRDLETITLKCLRKEISKRYSSASALADDLDRFLNGKVIEARPVGTMERAIKWCRRRPAIAGMLAFIVLLATASLITVTALWQSAATARDAEGSARADERGQRQRAEARSAELLIANARYAWLTDDLEGARQALAECPEPHRTSEWKHLNRACEASHVIVPPGTFPVECVAISGDGTMLAGGTTSNRVFVWDAKTGRERLSAQLPNRSAHNLTFTQDGRLAVAMNAVRLFLPGNQRRETLEVVFLDLATARASIPWDRPDRPMRIAIAPGGRHVASLANNSKVVHLIDAATGAVVHQFEARTGLMRSIGFSPDGQYLGTSETPHELRIWHVKTGLPVGGYVTRETYFGVNAIATAPDGRRMVVAANTSGRSAELILFSPDDEVRRLSSQVSSVSEIAISRDGRWVASFATSGTVIRVWSARTGEEEITLRGHPTMVRSMAFGPDGKQLVAGYADGRVVMWDLEG